MLSLFDILSDAASLRLSVPAEELYQPGMLELALLCSPCHPPWAAEPNQGSRQGLQELKKKKPNVRSFPAPAFRAREVWLRLLSYFLLFAVAPTRNIHREAGLSFTCWWMCDPQKQISTDSLLYRVQPSGNRS